MKTVEVCFDKMGGSCCSTKDKKERHPAHNETVPLKTVAWVAVGAVVLYQIYAWCYLIIAFTMAASGPSGSTMVVADEMAAKFPSQFVLFQKLVVLPIPNYAAKRYYESQRDFFLESARNFELHPYWSNQNEATEDMSFREVATERIRPMYRQLNDTGRMDYRIEKDRCAQFDFFRRNKIPHPKIQKTWYSLEELLDDVESGAAVETMEHWPAFFKACHLTQRSSLGTFPVPSFEKYDEHKQDLLQWVKDKWVYRSRDVDRPWQLEGDALTDELTPSFLVQEPMIQSGDRPHAAFKLDGRISVGLVEIKVEVLWGRVYIMLYDGSTVFLRNGEIEEYATGLSGILHTPAKATARSAWIRDEGYLDCVIETAERVANAAHIEYVRVDIFLDRGNPRGCAVNEISLSSGYVYYGHEPYIAKLWAGPLQRKAHKVLNSTAPVYELSSDMNPSI